MGIFDRLSDVIKSYLNDTGPGFSAGPSAGRRYADPDLDAAYEELNDFLDGKDKADGRTDTWENSFSQRGSAGNVDSKTPPESLRGDFDALGVPFGASAEECKAAYKRLLKLHHPDRHAGHEGNMKKATEKSARINAAYDRIEKWRTTGKAE
ncbi:J domain-containing protein [Treponema primitia]|uniref:J domain-containing protein n=1 Tax=Treponema primitia TaxID=88058 RepID=UPI00398112BF